ncbi:MAG: RnfABCDGE type electron transport complex subunit G [Acutalibacteraceae bacterium]|nr:RnfABCDGE type electron transport complex subunit G [Acutalibacteraceae bacterium]
MKKLDINKVPITTAILFIICIVVTAALAGTNYITKDRINELSIKAENDAMSMLVPADNYTDHTIEVESQFYTYYKAEKSGETTGYLITVSENGYGGEIKLMVGTDSLGKVTGVKILAADDETPGLGAKVKSKSFYGQYDGKVKDVVLQKNNADSSKNEVTAVTGATISSTAVNKAVNKALGVIDIIVNSEKAVDVGEGELNG